MLTVYAVLFLAVPAHSEIEQRLNVDVYTYDPQALPERQAYTPCKDTIETIDICDMKEFVEEVILKII